MASFSLANAQTSTNSPSWARVQGLPAGTKLHIKTSKAVTNCVFKSATATDLTCDGVSYPKVDVVYVKVRHHGQSIAAGAVIGAAGGGLIGTAAGSSNGFLSRGAATVLFALPGAVIGGLIGGATDFTHTLIYHAP
jgi:uncharacterized protein YcfJ